MDKDESHQMVAFPMVSVIRVHPLSGSRLAVTFTDGMAGVFDCAPLLAGGGAMAAPLKEPDFFARVFLEMGAPTWPNGYDLDPINLYLRLRDNGALTRSAIAAE